MKKALYWLSAASLIAALIFAGCANKYTTSGKIAMNSKNWDKAINDFKMAIQANPADAAAHYNLAKCYKEKNESLLMVEHLEKASALDPNYKAEAEEFRSKAWITYFDSGNSNAKAEKYDQALTDFQTAIVLLPSRYEAYTNAGYVWTKLDNNDSAYSYYAQAYNISPTKKDLLMLYANLSFDMKYYDKADSLYIKILESDTTDADAWFRRGLISNQKNEFDNAIKYYNKSLALAPDKCDPWFNLGLIYFQHLKNDVEAEKAFSRANELCPNDVEAQIYYSSLLIANNKLDDAITLLKSITVAHPNECVAWDLLSQALVRKGERKAAEEAMKKSEDCNASKQK